MVAVKLKTGPEKVIFLLSVHWRPFFTYFSQGERGRFEWQDGEGRSGVYELGSHHGRLEHTRGGTG